MNQSFNTFTGIEVGAKCPLCDCGPWAWRLQPKGMMRELLAEAGIDLLTLEGMTAKDATPRVQEFCLRLPKELPDPGLYGITLQDFDALVDLFARLLGALRKSPATLKIRADDYGVRALEAMAADPQVWNQVTSAGAKS